MVRNVKLGVDVLLFLVGLARCSLRIRPLDGENFGFIKLLVKCGEEY